MDTGSFELQVVVGDQIFLSNNDLQDVVGGRIFPF